MSDLLVHIERKEIDFTDTSVSAENVLPYIDNVTNYTNRELNKLTIASDSDYHSLANAPYRAFFLNAGDYILVSKWQNVTTTDPATGDVTTTPTMISEVSTKLFIEMTDNSDYTIQIKNSSGDNIEVSYGFYYGA